MDIRQAFLNYFASKNHTIIESSPLIPDDPTLLFTNAGMVQFKPIFVGDVPVPTNPRATTSQTCIRAGGKHNDLENVGYTARHHTFFEMLGNFSFGDYFKEDAIKYAWEFLTDVLKLDKEKLYISVHESDDEAERIWQKYVPIERIKRMGDADNFWQMGDTGPCGPCSEIYFDQGAEHFSSSEDYFGGEGDRFLEVWNLVFMQYNRDENGTLHPLPKPSIDTGMGLERITAIKEGVLSNYDSSLFVPLLEKISELTGKKYDPKTGASHRVIADHARSVVFLIAQGVNFDKEGRGYVLRRILRRAVRHGYLLGKKEPFLYKLVATLADQMKNSYPYIEEKASFVADQIMYEEERFFATIENGMKLFEAELAKNPKVFSGELAFKLYDTFGFPLDLTEDMLKHSGIALDHAGFDKAMEVQRSTAKAAWKGSGDEAKEGDFKQLLEIHGKNSFVGYDKTICETTVLALLDSDFKVVEKLASGKKGWVMLRETPLYATGGGQVGDQGEIVGFAKVLNTEKFFDLILSEIETTADLVANQVVTIKVDERRKETARHHSATHLLHSALHEILGSNATQAGSLVESNRLRFDFNYPKALSVDQLVQIEDRVNELIRQATGGRARVMSLDQAKKSGAKALFGEKYGNEVRVVDFGETSIEFCGGIHVANTSEIGQFILLKESGVSAGVRRIEAVVSRAAYNYMKNIRETNAIVASKLRSPDIVVSVDKLQLQIKELKKEIEKLSSGGQKEMSSELISGVNVVIETIESGDSKKIVDEIKNRYESVAVMIFLVSDEKVVITAGSKNAPIKAGEWVREISTILGGKGGGRDDFASGGGNDKTALDQAKSKALEFVKSKL